MSGTSIKKKIIREISSEDWGQSAKLMEEEGYSIEEHTVLSGKTLRLQLDNTTIYFIVVSGTAEFESSNNKNKYFKSAKVCLSEFCTNSENDFININNCGVIPLILVEVRLNTK